MKTEDNTKIKRTTENENTRGSDTDMSNKRKTEVKHIKEQKNQISMSMKIEGI